MKTKLIELGCVVVVLMLLALMVIGCKDKAEAIDFEDIIIVDLALAEEFSNGQKYKCEGKDYRFDSERCVFVLDKPEPNYTDIEFVYDNNGVTEELTLNIIDGEIVCSKPPKKAIEIIFKTLCQSYNIRDVENWPVRFEEPNE